MAQTLLSGPSHPLPRFREGSAGRSSPSSRRSSTHSSLSASVSPPPSNRVSASPRGTASKLSATSRRQSSEAKENVEPNLEMDGYADPSQQPSRKANGKLPEEKRIESRTLREVSDEPEGIRARKNPRKSNPATYDGLPTLDTISDLDTPTPGESSGRRPPPAPSAAAAAKSPVRPVTRQRRSSSIKRKPSPGATPQKAVDWEIPRKTLHSSVGVLTLLLYHLDPPTIGPLLTGLITLLCTILIADFLRFRFPAFAELWESQLGFLMRESERNKINGVVWYLIGVIFVLSLYPRDVAVVAILTLSWADTTASTLGRLWGRYTPPLPAHFPGIKALPFAPRKSLAGFLAATVTGLLTGLGFWWNGSGGRWTVLDAHAAWGLWMSAGVVGIGGAIVEALDLGLDDNLTLPILSGAVVWTWLSVTNLVL